MDIVDKATRSRMMAAVGRSNTGPELVLRRALHRLGLRYLLHDRRLPGRPDMVFPRFRAVVFVHGCFWHAHGCRLSAVPATRKAFWEEKFASNRTRDVRVADALDTLGWRSLTVWQCALSGADEILATASKVKAWLEGEAPTSHIPAEPRTGARPNSVKMRKLP